MKRPSAFVVHVLGAVGAELEPGRADGGVLGIIHHDVPRLVVGHPIRECGNHIDPVEALCLSVPHIILKTGLRSNRTLLIVLIPAKSICPERPPGVAQHEERGAIGLFEGMMIRCRPQKTASQRIGLFFRFGPGVGLE